MSESAKKARRFFGRCVRQSGILGEDFGSLPSCMEDAIADKIGEMFSTATEDGKANAQSFCSGGYYPTPH